MYHLSTLEVANENISNVVDNLWVFGTIKPKRKCFHIFEREKKISLNCIITFE